MLLINLYQILCPGLRSESATKVGNIFQVFAHNSANRNLIHQQIPCLMSGSSEVKVVVQYSTVCNNIFLMIIISNIGGEVIQNKNKKVLGLKERKLQNALVRATFCSSDYLNLVEWWGC